MFAFWPPVIDLLTLQWVKSPQHRLSQFVLICHSRDAFSKHSLHLNWMANKAPYACLLKRFSLCSLTVWLIRFPATLWENPLVWLVMGWNEQKLISSINYTAIVKRSRNLLPNDKSCLTLVALLLPSPSSTYVRILAHSTKTQQGVSSNLL